MYYVSVNLQGGLGNLMFQIATGYALCLRDNKTFVPDASQIAGAHYPLSRYTNNVFRKIKFTHNPITDFPHHGEGGFHYTPIHSISSNMKLFGFFQSEKYFKEFSHEVRKLFEIPEEIEQKLNLLYGFINNRETCFIHIRRGNYHSFQDYHPILDLEYYKEAVKLFDDSTLFLIFSNDMDWCEQNFDFVKNKVFVNNLEDYEEIYLMSMCQNSIIANSTFSWWGSWLNPNNKKTVSPKTWFGSKLSVNNTKDLYCENWIIL